MKRYTWLFGCLFFCLVPGLGADSLPWISAKGTSLKTDQGKPFLPRGMAFGNQVWGNPDRPDLTGDHSLEDYAYLKGLGFNTVRFYLNEAVFQTTAGWDWLRANLTAAGKNGIYLLLNLHYPPGGYQSNGQGDALWTQPENQEKLVRLWEKLAAFCRDDAVVLGYGLVNEPVPVGSLEAWQKLAQRLVGAVRNIDRRHLIFVERAIWIKADQVPADPTQFPFPVRDAVDPPQLVWEFHFYDPMPFTHQGASWVPSLQNVRSRYPDPNRFEPAGLTWKGLSPQQMRGSTGTFDWQVWTSPVISGRFGDGLLGRPVLQAARLGKDGQVEIRHLRLDQVDAEGRLLQTLGEWRGGEAPRWQFWAQDGSGESRSSPDSAAVAGTLQDANLTSEAGQFLLQGEAFYRLSAEVKGTRLPSTARVGLRLDCFSFQALNPWTKEGLASRLAVYLDWRTKTGQPVFLGEFGVNRPAWQGGRGAGAWIGDVLAWAEKNRVGWNFHAWHEPAFGALPTPSGIPSSPLNNFNPALRQVFLQKIAE